MDDNDDYYDSDNHEEDEDPDVNVNVNHDFLGGLILSDIHCTCVNVFAILSTF